MVQCTWLWCAKLLYFYRFFNILTIYSDKLHREEGDRTTCHRKNLYLIQWVVVQLVSVIAKPFIRSTRVWDVKIKKSTFVLSSILQFKCIVSIWSVYVLVEGKLSIGGTFFWAWILALCVYSDWICVLDDLLCVTPYHVRGICVCLCVWVCVLCMMMEFSGHKWNLRMSMSVLVGCISSVFQVHIDDFVLFGLCTVTMEFLVDVSI